ncbi:MAG TPA: hypothetical protein VE862_06465 [Candidatus Acidoferrum sp.]|nr:hypothetical protein [Candidatus Acidoferrum sp.]
MRVFILLILSLSLSIAARAPHPVSAQSTQQIAIDNVKLFLDANNEFVSAYAHLFGNPAWNLINFARVQLDASASKSPISGNVEVDVGSYASPGIVSFTIQPGQVGWIGVNPTFNNNIAQISSPTPITVYVKVTDSSGNQLAPIWSENIEILPLNYYVWIYSANPTLQEMIAQQQLTEQLAVVLATPHADPIQKILSAAAWAMPDKALEVYSAFPGFSDYEVDIQQLQAIYNVLKNLNITYISTETTFTSTDAQRVRLPVQTLSDSAGNCIETTLLFDSILEEAGFTTYFVFVNGHVYVAVQEWNNGPHDGSVDPNDILVIETTMLSTSTFQQSLNYGLEEFNLDQKIAQQYGLYAVNLNGTTTDESYNWQNYDNCVQSPPDNWGEGCYFFLVNVPAVRQQHADPTPYMDTMQDPTTFDQKVNSISSQIRSADDSIAQVQNLQTNGTTISANAEQLLNESIGLFNNGSYVAAGDAANQAYQLSTESMTTASSMPGSGGNFTFLGAAAGIVIVAVVIAFAVMRQKRGTRPQHTDESKTKRESTPAGIFCASCGAAMGPQDKFCPECGAKD